MKKRRKPSRPVRFGQCATRREMIKFYLEPKAIGQMRDICSARGWSLSHMLRVALATQGVSECKCEPGGRR